MTDTYNNEAIAIVGMACRLPGADNILEFADNIKNNADGVRTFSRDFLLERGLSESYVDNPALVPRGGIIDNIDQFDPAFFGFSPGEAQIMDPQLRLSLQCAYTALEDANYTKESDDEKIGVISAIGKSSYFLHNLMRRPEIIEKYGLDQTMIYNDRAFIATTLSNRLNLTGASYTMDTACSSSLVAVHLGIQMLLSFEVDLVVVGGAALHDTVANGYVCHEGGMVSPDGICRPFSDGANGTVPGCGVGYVVLKRAEDAIEDEDRIYSVILGSAVNNDGARKSSFTSPSVDGQMEVIRAAQSVADIDPDSIGYIETHGTGTKLGDPIEISALVDTYNEQPDQSDSCVLGALKANIGHLTTAAGVAGLIKTALCLQQQIQPAVLHIGKINPYLNLDDTRFEILEQARHWDSQGPRRAAVSAFGVGGSNAHMILQEPPQQAKATHQDKARVLVVSAKSQGAVDRQFTQLQQVLDNKLAHPADIAHTLYYHRPQLPHKGFAVVTADGQIERFKKATQLSSAQPATTVFAFQGQGTQYFGLGRQMWRDNAIYRQAFEQCAQVAKAHAGLDLIELLYGEQEVELADTSLSQPILFAVEYAMAKVLANDGITADIMLGHSLGEYVAVCLAGLFSLEDAMKLVCDRGRIMASAPAGAMISVLANFEQIQPLLEGKVEIAGVNGNNSTAISGTVAAIENFSVLLSEQGFSFRSLPVSHGYHSSLMDSILPEFKACFDNITFGELNQTVLSDIDGQPLTQDVASSSDYWVKHLRHEVRFDLCINTVIAKGAVNLIEIGPGKALSRFIEQSIDDEKVLTLNVLPGRNDKHSDQAQYLSVLAGLWCTGASIDLEPLFDADSGNHIALTGYSFEPNTYWYDAASAELKFNHFEGNSESALATDATEMLYSAQFKSLPFKLVNAAKACRYVLVGANQNQLNALADTLVTAGNTCDQIFIDATEPQQNLALDELATQESITTRVVYLAPQNSDEQTFEQACINTIELGATLLSEIIEHTEAAEALIVSFGVHDVSGSNQLNSAGMLESLAYTLSKEMAVKALSLDLAANDEQQLLNNANKWFETAMAWSQDYRLLVLRGNTWWTRCFEKISYGEQAPQLANPFANKHIMITGGLGGIGLSTAVYALENDAAHVTLLSRREQNSIDDIPSLQFAKDKVSVVQADVADYQQLTQALDNSQSNHGKIDGVIHAAGIAGGRLLKYTSKDNLEEVYGAKLNGALNLVKYFANSKPDFIALCSSMLSTMGSQGQVAYSGANAALNQLANHSSLPLVSLNWDTWLEVGMAAQTAAKLGLSADDMAFALKPKDGNKALHLALCSGLTEVYISRRDVPKLYQESALKAYVEQTDEFEHTPTNQQGIERTAENPYVAPEDELQEFLVTQWESYLGIEGIGIDDNFFDLGGHSLVAGPLISKLNLEYELSVGFESVFEYPTIREFSDFILESALQEMEA